VRKLAIVAAMLLTLCVLTSELPELLHITDDASNDFVVATYSPKPASAPAVQHLTFSPGHPGASFDFPFSAERYLDEIARPSPSGPELLQFLSIRRT